MASSVFIWPGNITFPGSVTVATNLSVGGVILNASGTAVAPSYSFTADATTGFFRDGGGYPAVSISGAQGYRFQSDALVLRVNGRYAWSSTADPAASPDLYLVHDAANTLAQVNGVNPQASRLYGYLSGSRLTRGSMHTVVEAVTLSGASTATSNIIPAGCFVMGVATTTTTAITGASGYTVGDGSDVDRYGDITGTALGTHSDNTNATANPTGYNAAASAITLTAKTSNFTGGVVQVCVYYMTTAAT